MRLNAKVLAILSVSVSVFALASCDVNPKPAPDMRAELNKLVGPNVGSIDKTLSSQAANAVSIGDFRRASQMYKQLADEHPDNKEYVIALADSLRRSGDNEDALKIIDECLKKNPDDAAALEEKGLSQMAMGEFSDSSKTFEKVMSIDSHRWRTLNALGIMFAIKKMQPQAIAYYNAALEASPDNAGVLNNLGLSQAMDRQYDKSIETFMRARGHVDNKSAQLRHIDLDMALVYALAGRLDDAERVATPHLNKAELYNNMAFYAYISKNSELAKTYLNMALTQDPAYYERAWKNLSAINGDTASEGNSDDDERMHELQNEVNLAASRVPSKSNAASDPVNEAEISSKKEPHFDNIFSSPADKKDLKPAAPAAADSTASPAPSAKDNKSAANTASAASAKDEKPALSPAESMKGDDKQVAGRKSDNQEGNASKDDSGKDEQPPAPVFAPPLGTPSDSAPASTLPQ